MQLLICGKDGPAALAAAHDDEKMELLFKAVYAALPFPVHLAVQVASFIKFCFTHRDQLLSCGEAAAGAAGREVVWGTLALPAGSFTGLEATSACAGANPGVPMDRCKGVVEKAGTLSVGVVWFLGRY